MSTFDTQQGRYTPRLRYIINHKHSIPRKKKQKMKSITPIMNDSVAKICLPFTTEEKSDTQFTFHGSQDSETPFKNEKLHFIKSTTGASENMMPSPRFEASVTSNNNRDLFNGLDIPKRTRARSQTRRSSALSKRTLMRRSSPNFVKLYDPALSWHKPGNNFWSKIIKMNKKAIKLANRNINKSKPKVVKSGKR